MNAIPMPTLLSGTDPVLWGSVILLGLGLLVGAAAVVIQLLHVLFGMKRTARR